MDLGRSTSLCFPFNTVVEPSRVASLEFGFGGYQRVPWFFDTCANGTLLGGGAFSVGHPGGNRR